MLSRDNGEGLPAVSFGAHAPGAFYVPLRQLGPDPLMELWPQANGELLFGAVSLEERDSIESLTRDAYTRIIEEVRAAGHPYFVRMWNHVGGINEHDEDGERYQLFCAGRHDAFVAAGYHHGADLPAASAVGSQGRGLVIYVLAAREPGVQVENPRQVSAYDYPPLYGVRSPSFARATVSDSLIFVAGTSSVVGHETKHAGNVSCQLGETLKNLDVIISTAADAKAGLADMKVAKVYIRHPRNYAEIASELSRALPQATLLYVESDICRSDLLLEIEGVVRLS